MDTTSANLYAVVPCVSNARLSKRRLKWRVFQNLGQV
jgi:hypothetical protein